MATRKSRRRNHISRTRLPVTKGPESVPAPAACNFAEPDAAIDQERLRLMSARSILRSLAFTMSYYREAGVLEVKMDAGDFADVAEVAGDLVQTAIENLDSINLEKPKRSYREEGKC